LHESNIKVDFVQQPLPDVDAAVPHGMFFWIIDKICSMRNPWVYDIRRRGGGEVGEMQLLLVICSVRGRGDGGESDVLYIYCCLFFTHTCMYIFLKTQISMTKLILVVTKFPPLITWMMTTFGRTHANQSAMCKHCLMAMLTTSPDSSSPP
jgi:hypothetical protein